MLGSARGVRTLACLAASALVGCAATDGGAPRSTDDASLKPPSERGIVGTDARSISRRVVAPALDWSVAFPKRSLEQRVAFLAACETSLASGDAGVVADVRALRELYTESSDLESFVGGLLEGFELVESTDAKGRSSLGGLATGYATPVAIVREQPDELFRFPILGDFRLAAPELAEAGRAAILASDAARATAIAWIDDPVSWALIETNGTGRLLVDGTTGKREILVSRIGTNGREWKGLGRFFAEKGLIDPATSTLDDVIEVARAKPELAEEAALANDRVVAFQRVPPNRFAPPFGIVGGRLVGGYSCAADQTVYPPGSVLVVVPRGAPEPRPARFLFVHDVGGAIEGPGRIDAYVGQGTEALLRAGGTRVESDVYLLRRRGAGR